MIRIEPFDKTDYDRLISWVGNADDLMQFAGPGFSFPLTIAQLDDAAGNVNRLAFRVVDIETNAVVGHAEIMLKQESAVLCRLLVGSDTMRGKGIGTALVRGLLRIAFTEFQQNLVELNVFDFNSAAIRCYQNAGFKINQEKTTVREWNDKIWTAVNMKISKDEWQLL